MVILRGIRARVAACTGSNASPVDGGACWPRLLFGVVRRLRAQPVNFQILLAVSLLQIVHNPTQGCAPERVQCHSALSATALIPLGRLEQCGGRSNLILLHAMHHRVRRRVAPPAPGSAHDVLARDVEDAVRKVAHRIDVLAVLKRRRPVMAGRAEAAAVRVRGGHASRIRVVDRLAPLRPEVQDAD
eukprot:scaffold208996_cov43-Tisochrysis_lutea.AAC.2